MKVQVARSAEKMRITYPLDLKFRSIENNPHKSQQQQYKEDIHERLNYSKL